MCVLCDKVFILNKCHILNYILKAETITWSFNLHQRKYSCYDRENWGGVTCKLYSACAAMTGKFAWS